MDGIERRDTGSVQKKVGQPLDLSAFSRPTLERYHRFIAAFDRETSKLENGACELDVRHVAVLAVSEFLEADENIEILRLKRPLNLVIADLHDQLQRRAGTSDTVENARKGLAATALVILKKAGIPNKPAAKCVAHKLGVTTRFVQTMHANGPCRSPLRFGAILKEGSESKKRQKSEVATIHAQTAVCESH